MLILPSGPTGTITRLGTVWPGPKLRLEARGRATPLGCTVKKLVAVGPVTVRLSTTPTTPVAGTPPWPVTCSETVASGPSGPAPARVSSSRAGGSGWYMPLPSVADSGVVTQPATSKMASVEPAEPLNTLTLPSGPSGTSTRLGTVAPAVKLRLEASGRALPPG